MNKKSIIAAAILVASVSAGSSYYYVGHHLPNVEKEKAAAHQEEERKKVIEAEKIASMVVPLDMSKFKQPKDDKLSLTNKKMTNIDGISKDVDLNKIKDINFTKVEFDNFFEKFSKENSLESLVVVGEKPKANERMLLPDDQMNGLSESRKITSKEERQKNGRELFKEAGPEKGEEGEEGRAEAPENNIKEKEALVSKSEEKDSPKVNLAFLETKTKMNTIELDGLTSLSALSKLKEVKTLTLNNYKGTSLDELSSLETAERIKVSSMSLTSIAALENLKGELELDIPLDKLEKHLSKSSELCQTMNIFVKDKGQVNRASGDNLDKICKDDGFVQLDREEIFKLNGNKSLDFLSQEDGIDIGSYEAIKIESDKISEIKDMSTFIRLKKVELNTPLIKDLSFLNTVMGLEELVIHNMSFGVGASLPEMGKIKSLVVDNVKNLDNLIGALPLNNKIETITILNSDISGFSVPLRELVELVIVNSNYNDTNSLSRSKHLDRVFFKNTQIRDVKGLEDLSNITVIKLQENKILADIEALSGFDGDLEVDNKNFLKGIGGRE